MFKTNEDIFQTLAEAIPEGVLVVDDRQEIVATNTSTLEIFGYDKGELEGKKLDLLLPKKYKPTHGAHFEGFKKEPEKRQMGTGRDLHGLKKCGKEFPIEVGLAPFSVNGKTFYMALLVDITIRKEMEKSTRIQSEALQSASNGIIITDATQDDNPIIYFNHAFQELTGYPEDEILNRNCRFMQAGDSDQEGVVEMRNAYNEGRSCHVVVRNYKKDGTLFWNETTITPIKDEKGTVTHFIGIQNDVTDRVNAEQERSHWGKIFDESLNEIYVFDIKSLRFISANKGAQNNIGYTFDELTQLTPISIKPDYSEKQFRKVIEPLIKKTGEKIEFETIHQRKDGTTYPVEVHLQSSTLGNRDVLVAIILDITDRRNYTEKLEKTVEKRTQQLLEALSKEKELNELKTKFLSLVSHEFKTPISGILTSAVLIGKYANAEHQEKRQKHLETIKSKVHYLDGILNDFLSVERLDTGKVNYRYGIFQLSKVFNEVIYNANMLLKSGQKINYPDNIEDITIDFDEKILELTITNLIGNAIKYSPEDTTIDIQISQGDEKLVLRIADQGIGIPKKEQKHLFQRYFRAENALTYQGTGIGLNIIKGHLDNLGGTISFKENEDRGSTFIVELPVKSIS